MSSWERNLKVLDDGRGKTKTSLKVGLDLYSGGEICRTYQAKSKEEAARNPEGERKVYRRFDRREGGGKPNTCGIKLTL